MALQKRIDDEMTRYKTVKDCLEALVSNNTEPLKIEKNSDGSFGFYIKVDGKEIIFRKTFKSFYQRCIHCELASIFSEVEKLIIESMQEEILKYISE